MNRFLLGIAILTLSLSVACGQSDDGGNANQDNGNDGVTSNEDQNNNNDTNDQDDNNMDNQNNDTTTDGTSSNDMQKKMDELNYTDFELAVEYTNDQEYEADLEQSKNNNVEAKLEDDLSGIKIKGEEAFNVIFPKVKSLTIDQNTSKDDVIKETLEAFDLSSDYTEFELELTFMDGTKIEFKDKK